MAMQDATTLKATELAERYLRRPTGWIDQDDVLVAIFEPPLSASEEATWDLIQAIARSGLNVAPDDYAVIRTNLQAIRDLRQMGRAAFMALTAAERDRLMYDAQSATTTILLAILRD